MAQFAFIKSHASQVFNSFRPCFWTLVSSLSESSENPELALDLKPFLIGTIRLLGWVLGDQENSGKSYSYSSCWYTEGFILWLRALSSCPSRGFYFPTSISSKYSICSVRGPLSGPPVPAFGEHVT